MSRTTLLAALEDGNMRRVHEYSNSWWSAMAVWTFMAERYLQPVPQVWLEDKRFTRRLWDLVDRQELPFIERVTLATTFDRVLVRGNERQLLFHCMKAGARLLPAENHIDRQAEHILALPGTVRAVGWKQTSVAANLWSVPVGDEDERAYNIDRDAEHWWLFDEVHP